jgi:hypothetical protein
MEFVVYNCCILNNLLSDPVTGHGMLRLPRCLDNQLTEGAEVVRITYRHRSTPQKLFLYLFLSVISIRG